MFQLWHLKGHIASVGKGYHGHVDGSGRSALKGKLVREDFNIDCWLHDHFDLVRLSTQLHIAFISAWWRGGRELVAYGFHFMFSGSQPERELHKIPAAIFGLFSLLVKESNCFYAYRLIFVVHELNVSLKIGRRAFKDNLFVHYLYFLLMGFGCYGYHGF